MFFEIEEEKELLGSLVRYSPETRGPGLYETYTNPHSEHTWKVDLMCKSLFLDLLK